MCTMIIKFSYISTIDSFTNYTIWNYSCFIYNSYSICYPRHCKAIPVKDVFDGVWYFPNVVIKLFLMIIGLTICTNNLFNIFDLCFTHWIQIIIKFNFLYRCHIIQSQTPFNIAIMSYSTIKNSPTCSNIILFQPYIATLFMFVKFFTLNCSMLERCAIGIIKA